jgi:phosphatidylglycerophosphatase A
MFIHPDDRAAISKLDLKKPYVWIATWFGTGFFRPGPGTWGSAASIPVALIIYALFGLPGVVVGIALISIAGYFSAAKFTKAIGEDDSKMIVIDEAAGQWITLLPALYTGGLNIILVALAFILFRLFDIAKPWPISWLDRNVKGAAGVMLDDILAGIFAGILIMGLHYAGYS